FPREILPVSHTGFFIKSGDGGNSLLGSGGRGGIIGGGNLTKTSNAATGALNFNYAGDLVFQGGHGGDGFAAGGAGGAVSGIVVRYRGGGGVVDVGLSVTATGGDGGRGVTASGGNGGSVAFNSFESAPQQLMGVSTSNNLTYVIQEAAGNGGAGAIG